MAILLDLGPRGLAEIGRPFLDLGDRGVARISRIWLDLDGRGVAKVFDDGMSGARRWRYRERVEPDSTHKIIDVPHIRWRYSERVDPTQDHNIIDSINRRWRYSERMDVGSDHTIIDTLMRRWRYSERIDPVSDHDITDAPPRRWRYSERVAPTQIHDIIVVPPKRWRYSERVYPTQVHDIIVAPPKRWRYSERVIPTYAHTTEDLKCDVTISGPDKVAGDAISTFQGALEGDCALVAGTWSSVIHNRYATSDRGWTSVDANGLITLDLPAVGGPTIYRIKATFVPSTGKAGTSSYFYFTADKGCSMGLSSTSGYDIDGDTEFKAQAQMVGQCEGPATLIPGPWQVSGTAATWVRINAGSGEIKGTAPNQTASYSLDVTWTDDKGTDFTERRTINVTRTNIPCGVTITSSSSQVRSQAEWTAQASLSGDCPAGVWSVQTLSMPNGTQNRTTNNVPWATIDQAGKITFKIPFDVGSNTDYRIRAWWTGTSDTYSGDYILKVLPPVDCHVMISGPGQVEVGKRWSGTATLDGTECPASVVWDAAGVDGITATPASVLAGASQKVNVSFTAPNTTGFVTIYVTAEDTNGLIDRGSYGIEIKEIVPCDVVLASTSGFTIDGLTRFAGQASTTGDCDGPGALAPGPWSVSGTATTGFGVTIDGNGAVTSGLAPNVDARYGLTVKWTDENGKAFFKSYTITVNKVAVPCVVTVTSSDSQVRALKYWNGQASRSSDCGAGSWSVASYTHPAGTANRVTNNVPWATINSNGLISFRVPFDVAGNPTYRIEATWTSGSEVTTGEFVVTVLPVLKCNVSISGKTTLNAGEQYTATASLSGTECPSGTPNVGEGWSLSGGWANLGIDHGTGSIVHRAPTPTTDTTYDLIATYTDESLVITGNIHRITVKAQTTVTCQATSSGPATVNAGDSVTVTFATTGDCGSPSVVDDPWTITAPNWMQKTVNGASAQSAPTKTQDETYTVRGDYSFDGKTASTSHQFTVKAAACAVTVTGSTSQVRSQRDWTGTATKTGSCGSGSWSVKTLNHPSGTTNRVTNNVPWATIDSNGAISFKIPFNVGSKTEYRIQAAWTSGTDITLGEFVLSVLPPLDCAVVLTGPSSVEAGKTWTGTASLDGSECPSGATWSASGIAGISASPSSIQVGAASSATISFTAPASAGTVDISVTAKDGTETLDTATKTITVTDPVTCDVAVTSTSGFNIDGGTKFAGQAATTGSCASPASAIPGPWSVSGSATTSFGVKIDGNGGITSGDAPNSSQQYSLTVTWTDVNGNQFSSAYTITVTYVPPTCTVGISSTQSSIVGPGTWTGQASKSNCGAGSWTVAVYNQGASNDRGWGGINQSSGVVTVNIPFAVNPATVYEVEAFWDGESSGRIGFTVLPPWNCTISGPRDMVLDPGDTEDFQITLGNDCPTGGTFSSSEVTVASDGSGSITIPSDEPGGSFYVSVSYSEGGQVASTSWNVTITDPDPCRVVLSGATAVRSGRNYTATAVTRGNCPTLNSDILNPAWSLSGGWSGLQIGVAGDIWGNAPTVSVETDYTLTATVEFDDGSTESDSLDVTVQPPVTGCTVTVGPVGGGNARVVEGGRITLSAAEDGNCGSSGTWSVGVSPSGPTVSINASNGGITFDAPATITGDSQDFTVTARWQSDDGSITESGSVNVEVVSFDCTVGIGGASYVDAGASYSAQATLAGTDCPTGTPPIGDGFSMSGGWSGLNIHYQTGVISGTAPSPSTDTSYWLAVTYTDGSTVVTGLRHRVTVRGTTGCLGVASGPSTVDSGDQVSVSFSTSGTCGSPSVSDSPWTITAPQWMTKTNYGASGTAPSDPDDQDYTVTGLYSYGGYTAAASHSFTVNGDGGGTVTCTVSGSPSHVVADTYEDFTVGIGVDANCGPGSWWASWGNIANPSATSTSITDYAQSPGSATLSFTWTRSSDGQQFTGSVTAYFTDGGTTPV